MKVYLGQVLRGNRNWGNRPERFREILGPLQRAWAPLRGPLKTTSQMYLSDVYRHPHKDPLRAPLSSGRRRAEQAKAQFDPASERTSALTSVPAPTRVDFVLSFGALPGPPGRLSRNVPRRCPWKCPGKCPLKWSGFTFPVFTCSVPQSSVSWILLSLISCCPLKLLYLSPKSTSNICSPPIRCSSLSSCRSPIKAEREPRRKTPPLSGFGSNSLEAP